MNKIQQLIKIVNEKEKDILIKESCIKLLTDLENVDINIDELEQFIYNLVNRRISIKNYTLSQLANLYVTPKNPKGVSKQYLSKEIKRGKLKAVKLGRNYLVEEEEVKRYLATKNIFLTG